MATSIELQLGDKGGRARSQPGCGNQRATANKFIFLLILISMYINFVVVRVSHIFRQASLHFNLTCWCSGGSQPEAKVAVKLCYNGKCGMCVDADVGKCFSGILDA